MFSHSGMIEAQSSIVNIQDLEADIVQDMVKYIYSGRVSLLLFIFKDYRLRRAPRGTWGSTFNFSFKKEEKKIRGGGNF